MNALVEGELYIIRWDDDPTEYVVRFLRMERGFFVFEEESGMKMIARPTAISVRSYGKK